MKRHKKARLDGLYVLGSGARNVWNQTRTLAVAPNWAVLHVDVPAGHIENSPAIHGWEWVDIFMSSPVGTTDRFCRPYGTWDFG